jgi:CAAX amino protease
MKKNKAILVYLLGTFIQLVSVCLVFFLLNRYSVQSNVLTISGIILGGISSALWGIIVANRYFHIHFKKILKDFFNTHTSYKHYLLSFFLIIFDFSFILFGGKMLEFNWYLPFLMFFKFILFGGIEEIGWRYVFQPILQKICRISSQQS